MLMVCVVAATTLFTGCKSGNPPTVVTSPVTDITLTTASSGGNITDDGGSAVISRGICWSTDQEPTTDDNKTSDGTGTGQYTSDLTGLAENTTYYVRAYAVNSEGTAYGELQTFTTGEAGMATVVTTPVNSLTENSVVAGGNVTSDGGHSVTERGVVWSITEEPTIENNKVPAGSGTGTFTANVTGLSDGTVYYLRSYASSDLGTVYGNQVVIITSVRDIEENVYKTTKIGNQVWMAENLKTTKYNDNTPIPNVTDNAEWMNLTTPAYSWYGNDPATKETYGALYSWFTISDKLCPAGWHVASNAEYETLEAAIGIPADSIGFWGWRGSGSAARLKDSVNWLTGAGQNTSGFSSRGSGYRAWTSGQFRALGEIAYYWTSTDDSPNNKPTVAWYRRIDATSQYIYKATTEKQGGKSIRCVKD